jgi:hypothetical protein
MRTQASKNHLRYIAGTQRRLKTSTRSRRATLFRALVLPSVKLARTDLPWTAPMQALTPLLSLERQVAIARKPGDTAHSSFLHNQMQSKQHPPENVPFVSSEFFNELTRQWRDEAKVS